MAAKGEGEHLDDDAPLFQTDEFRMYCMKIQPCAKRYVHDWVTCNFSHPGEKAKRRDPRYFVYTGIACPSMKKAGACSRGEKCPYAHNVFEYWLHPTRYRTQLCNDGMGCRRRVCFFAHSLAQLRVPAAKPFVPPEVLSVLEGPQPANSEAVAAADQAMRRISETWQDGARRGSGEQQPAPPGSAAQVQSEAQMMKHLHSGDHAERVVQQLRAGSEDSLVGDASLQARLVGALAAMKRSRSADDGQDALIAMLRSMLAGTAQQPHQQGASQQARSGGNSRNGSASNLWDQRQFLQQAQLQLQQLQQLQARLQQQEAQQSGTGGSSAGGWQPAVESHSGRQQPQHQASLPQNRPQQQWAGDAAPGLLQGQASLLQQPHQQQWAGNAASELPHLSEHVAAMQAAGYSTGANAFNPQIQQVLAAAEAASSSHSSGSRPLTPSAAEEYASWTAGAGGGERRASLQQDTRPSPAHGHYPRRRSLQVEDWHPPPNPFARAANASAGHRGGPDGGSSPRPVPLQDFPGGSNPSAYSNMFDNWHSAGPLPAHGIQSTFLQPPPGSSSDLSLDAGTMHFPTRWPPHAAPRSSLDSAHPGGGDCGRPSIEVQPRPTPEAYSQRLSLDVNMLRGSDGQWGRGGSYGSAGRASAAFSDTDMPGSGAGEVYGGTGGSYGGEFGSGCGQGTSGGEAYGVAEFRGGGIHSQASGGLGDGLGPLPPRSDAAIAAIRRSSTSPGTPNADGSAHLGSQHGGQQVVDRQGGSQEELAQQFRSCMFLQQQQGSPQQARA